MCKFQFNSRIGCMIILLFSFISASAYDFVVDGIYYNVTDLANLECEVTSGDSKYVGSVSIPSAVTLKTKTFSVKKIGDKAFDGCEDLNYVKIPNSVVSIGSNAFAWCTMLNKVVIPDSVQNIGKSAFERCNSLKTVTIGNSVTQIEDFAFSWCSSLSDLTIGNSVKTIGGGAFDNCESLESVVLPNTVESLGRGAFRYCRSLSKIELSENLKVLECGTFYLCDKLIEIVIPGSVERIVGSQLYQDDSTVFTNLRHLTLVPSDKKLVLGEYVPKNGEIVFIEGTNDRKEQYFDNGATWMLGLNMITLAREVEIPAKLSYLHRLYLGGDIKEVQIDLKECDNLKRIVCFQTEPPKLPECSTKQYLNVVVVVPKEALQKYQQAPVWKEFMNLEGEEF